MNLCPPGHLLFELKTPVDQMLKKKLFPGTTLYISQECFQTLLEVSEAFPFCGQNQKSERVLCACHCLAHCTLSFAYAGSSTQPALLAHPPHGLMPTLQSWHRPASLLQPFPGRNTRPYLNPSCMFNFVFWLFGPRLFSPVVSATKSNGIS